VNGDGSQVRDFVHVSDVSQANLRALEASGVNGAVFNIGTGTTTSINELALAMLRLSGRPHIKPRHAPERRGDLSYSCADVTKASSTLDYRPTTKLAEGIAEVLSWFSERTSRHVHSK
jgi:UDP-glucose 4-epimerase